MKTILFFIFLAFWSFAKATDYYVKTGGNDLNSGTSELSAWATIDRVNLAFTSLKPGDRILFRRGDTFYGTIKVLKSGIAGSPITIGTYGSGEKPVITGFTIVSEWTDEGNGIYSSHITSEGQTNMLTIDGAHYGMGRWPDNKFNIFESASTNVSITDNELGTAIDWTGAEIVIRKNDWSLDRCKITDHSGTKLTYTSLGTTQVATPGHGYFIQNDIRTLSEAGEWFHDYQTGKLYIYFGSGSPSDRVVKVATLNTLIYNEGFDYITMDNIHLAGSNSHAITYLSYVSNYCSINNCKISFAGLDGIHLLGNYTTINNNQITDCNQTGIRGVGTNLKITNNNLKNIGIITGQALCGSFTTGIMLSKYGSLLQYNSIENVGYCGIGLSSDVGTVTIRNNYINNVMLLLNDGGGIYTTSGGTSRIIDGNIIFNVIGNPDGTPYPTRHIARGIYLDVNSSNVQITNNTVAHCVDAGYIIHKSYNNRLENNTSFNNGSGLYFQNTSGSNIRNNTISNNILFAKNASQLAMKFGSAADDILLFGTADNNYYARPVDDYNTIYTSSPSTGSKSRTLEGWQTFSGQDLNSKKSPVALTDTADIDFYYNASTSNKVISLEKPMIDVKGTKYKNSLTLLPYTSVILMPDPNPSQIVIPVYSSSVIENATPNLMAISFNNDLSNVLPPASSFLVVVNGINRKINSVSISGNKVILALESKIVYGDKVTIVYTKPATNPLQTPSGGQAVSISAQPVKNNCSGPANKPPQISLSSPTKGTTLTSPATFIIDISASDPDGSIRKVELFIGNNKIGELTSAPYIYTLKDLPEGNYSLTAVATDNLNSTSSSSTLDFKVIAYNSDREVLNLYPNPNNGYFSIDFKESAGLQPEYYSIVVVNIAGKTVYQSNLTHKTETSQFDLSHLNPGTYIVMIKSDLIIVTQKFIKT